MLNFKNNGYSYSDKVTQVLPNPFLSCGFVSRYIFWGLHLVHLVNLSTTTRIQNIQTY